MSKEYILKMVITKERQTEAFRFGSSWYNMDSKFCPLSTGINNTQDLSKANKFDTREEARKHMDSWFHKGSYEIVEK